MQRTVNMDSDSNSWSSEEVNRLLLHALDEFEQSIEHGTSSNIDVISNEPSRSVSTRNEQREHSASSSSRTSEVSEFMMIYNDHILLLT